MDNSTSAGCNSEPEWFIKTGALVPRWWWLRRMRCMDDWRRRRTGRCRHRHDRGCRSGDRHVIQAPRGRRRCAAAYRPPICSPRFCLSRFHPVGPNRPAPPDRPRSTVKRMRAIGAAATSTAADLQRAMGAFARRATPPSGPRRPVSLTPREQVAARLPRQQWPDRPMIVAAVNAHTGELVAFDRGFRC